MKDFKAEVYVDEIDRTADLRVKGCPVERMALIVAALTCSGEELYVLTKFARAMPSQQRDEDSE